MVTTTRGRGKARAEPSDPIIHARAEVERLHRAELDLIDRRSALTAELSEAEHAAGDAALSAALEGGDAAAAIGPAARLRAEIGALDAAIDAARERRRAAIPRVWAEEMKPLLGRAAALRREADERQPKTDALLQQLREWEGVEYAPVEPQRPDVNGWQGGATFIISVPTPRTTLLRLDADGLEQQAAALERRTVQDRGSVEAQGTAELVERIRACDVMVIAPRVDRVAEWAMAQEQRQQARIARMDSVAVDSWAHEAAERLRRTMQDGSATEADAAGRPSVRLALTWVGGAIDERASRSWTPALDS